MVNPTIQQQTPTSLPKQTAAAARATFTGESQDRDDQAIGDAFGAMLALSRGTIGEQLKSDGDRAVGQMFDAQGNESGSGKMSELNDEYRSAIGDSSDRRRDARTGVTARGEASRSENNSPSADVRSETDPTAKDVAGKQQDYFASLRPVASRIDETPQRSQVETSSRPDFDIQSRGVGSQRDASAPPPIDTTQGVGASLSVGATSATGSGGASSVAEEIGQLLGASRIGDTQGVRPTAAPNASDQRASSNDRQAQTSARAKQPSASANQPKVIRDNTRTPFDKLVGKMRLRMSENRSTAQLRLNPAGLGRIRVDVRLAGDRLVVGVQAESEAARDLLSLRVDRLKATLQEQGIQIDRIDVVMNTDGESPNATVVSGDAGGAKQFSREDTQSSSPPSSRGAQGGASRNHDGAEVAGIAASAPTVALDTRLDIRI